MRVKENPDCLIIRHAHRMSMPSETGEKAGSDFDEDQVPISSEGAHQARERGFALAGKYDFIYHSPVLRCKQTAEQISLTSGIPVASELSFLSSNFFDELMIANEVSKKDIVASMLENSGVGYEQYRLYEKVNFLLRRFEDFAKNGRSIYVSHDWWMALFLSWNTSLYQQIGYSVWPNFLEGFGICHESRQITYRGACYRLPNADSA